MLKQKIKIFLLNFVLGLTITSCATFEPIQIQVLNPAKVKVSPAINKVVLINHAIIKNNQLNSNSDSLNTDQYFAGLLQVMGNSPRFEIAGNKPININKPSQYEQLGWSVINKICADSSADAVIVLENCQVKYTDPIKIILTDYGFYGSLEMDNNSIWKIYIPQVNKTDDNYYLKDTLFWDASGVLQSEVLEKIPKITDATMQSCFYAGVQYGERICQTWSNKTRYLIVCEKPDFQRALQLAKQNKWNEAIEIWKKYPYGKNKRLGSYAAYNLAVASETLDHIDIALEWASKSYLLKHSEFIEYYISTLEKHDYQKKVIEEQLK